MKKYTVYILLIFAFVGCVSKEIVKPSEPPNFDVNTASGLYEEAKFYLKFKDYGYAQRSFATIVEDFPEDALADDAQFMVAEILSNPKSLNQDLQSAIDEYKSLVDNYPDSPFIKKAQKKISELERSLKNLK